MKKVFTIIAIAAALISCTEKEVGREYFIAADGTKFETEELRNKYDEIQAVKEQIRFADSMYRLDTMKQHNNPNVSK